MNIAIRQLVGIAFLLVVIFNMVRVDDGASLQWYELEVVRVYDGTSLQILVRVDMVRVDSGHTS